MLHHTLVSKPCAFSTGHVQPQRPVEWMLPQHFIFIFYFLKKLFIYLFIYFWLCWVFVSVRGLSPVAASGGHSSLWCAGLSLSWPLLLRSTGSRRTGSVIVAHGPSCSVACGILPDQGSNPCPLHWQADSQPLRHQGSPTAFYLNDMFDLLCCVTGIAEELLFPKDLRSLSLYRLCQERQ